MTEESWYLVDCEKANCSKAGFIFPGVIISFTPISLDKAKKTNMQQRKKMKKLIYSPKDFTNRSFE